MLAKVKTVDGVGSGLDADLLDGQQGSYYQPASSAITTGNIGSQLVSNADTVDGYHATAFARAAQGEKADAAAPKSWFTSGVAGSWSSHSVPAGGAWFPPAGLYIFRSESDVTIQVYDGSSFHVVAIALGATGTTGGMYLTDGSILKISNPTTSTRSIYYRKLL